MQLLYQAQDRRDSSWSVLAGTASHGTKARCRFQQDIVNILEGNIKIIQKMQLKVGVQQRHSQASPEL